MLLLQRGRQGITMAAEAHDTIIAARLARRADAGTVRLSQRDIDGLLMCGEHYGCRYNPATADKRSIG